MPEPEGSTTCTLCNRAVYASDVNSSGRCVNCAGVRAEHDAPEPSGAKDDEDDD